MKTSNIMVSKLQNPIKVTDMKSFCHQRGLDYDSFNNKKGYNLKNGITNFTWKGYFFEIKSVNGGKNAR